MYEPTTALTAMPEHLPVMLNLKTVSEILGISDKHARDLAREGQLDGAVKVGAVWRVSRDKFMSQFGLA